MKRQLREDLKSGNRPDVVDQALSFKAKVFDCKKTIVAAIHV
jgi:hypothetical protein